MRLKKEDREGMNNIGSWWAAEGVIDSVHRALKFGRRRITNNVSYKKAEPPTSNPDGSPYTHEQRDAWWHKTLTSGMVRYITEHLKVELDTEQQWRHNNAKTMLYAIKAALHFRGKYPQAFKLGSTVEGYTTQKHVRAYRQDETVPWNSIKRTMRIHPLNITNIQAALSGLDKALEAGNKRVAEAAHQRNIINHKRQVEQSKANIILTQERIDAFDVEANEANIKAVKDWLETAPACLSRGKRLDVAALLPFNALKQNYEGSLRSMEHHVRQLTVSEAWLAENVGGEEE